MFTIYLTEQAQADYDALQADAGLKKRAKAVDKTLSFLAENPRHPSLQTHEFTSLSHLFGRKIFEAYAEQNTSAAYRVFWYYGPSRKEITVVAITQHP